ncbi:hypothetical protein A0H81_14563 [Grifola frondosa]|uniref:Uncharacterized protein n=1 Tax=Grifola frondosa TaxID=5627 RepID=A0A1C7LL74_GRIFR|nr:hypothetical protein A0H81_14563 [Grifola frondosa]
MIEPCADHDNAAVIPRIPPRECYDITGQITSVPCAPLSQSPSPCAYLYDDISKVLLMLRVLDVGNDGYRIMA